MNPIAAHIDPLSPPGSTPPTSRGSTQACTGGAEGSGLYAKNIHLLFVNGAGYEERETREAAKKISTIFNDAQVCYMHIPMGLLDVIKTLRSKAKPLEHPALLQQVRDCLRGTNNGKARLAIFAHSGGAIVVRNIISKLAPEERSRIDVFTFGGASMIKHTKLHSAINVIARWDPFPALGRLVSGKWWNNFADAGRTYWPAGSFFQVPIICHKFMRPPYQEALLKIRALYDAEGALTAAKTC